MDYEFQTNTEALRIPLTAYRPVQRCLFCQSVFIASNSCESCGRSTLYHPIGEPFSVKSFYGIKERYLESLFFFYRFYPVFENKRSLRAKSYVRNLSKRFSDLITAFHSPHLILEEQRKLFFLEAIELINELVRYGSPLSEIKLLLEGNDNSDEGIELLNYLRSSVFLISAEKSWRDLFLEYRLWGILRLSFCVKVVIIVATVATLAVQYRLIISSQLGK